MKKGKAGRQTCHHTKRLLDKHYRKQRKGYAKNEYDKPTAGDTIQ